MNSKERNIDEFKYPFKFTDVFMNGLNTMIDVYNKKINDLTKIKSLIDKNVHHGVCTCSYKMRYITPSDVSTFISNLAKAMENKLIKPNVSDSDMFAVESVKRFLKDNGCVPFDAPTIMGNSGADIPKGATLADLTFAAESECFGLIVYSKYELDKRADDMKKDIDTIIKMRFSTAIKAFVNSLPDIMNKNATFIMRDALLSQACVTYIEDFVMFALRLNLTTVIQMLNYAIPRVAYKNEPVAFDDSNESANNSDNWDDDNEFFKMESVDETSTSPVFFVFTKGKSPIISKAISKATDSDFTHISVSFDSSLDNMYSFGGMSFRKESIHDAKRKNLDIEVYGTYMSNNSIDKMKDICSDMISNIKKTSFDYPALIKRLFGSDNKKESNYKHVCTTFVNKLLSSAGTSLSEKNIPSPEEMRQNANNKPDQIFQLYSGNSKDYNRKKASDELKNKGNEPKAKRFDEVVTECCTGFLKTNDYVITNKIPFNCNMRDIVLQDMHPQFKDTVSALKFIMNDSRSPIHILIVKYYTEPIENYDPDLIIKMFFGTCRQMCEDMNTREGYANDRCDMHTDVNWLDKITYGNMFLDGNYRRDGLGNQHQHPIMNTFESIYRMFGGCDDVCDNNSLANSLIRISRVMKAIIEKYNCGCIPNWEMCRDILAVFGEIFTRHMLRLYYNNNRVLVSKDQMDDTMIPGYMYAEQFVFEANGFTSNEKNQQSTAKKVGINLKNLIQQMINWLRDKAATFMPKFFESSLSKQCQWFNTNGENKYNEIIKAVESNPPQYHFPKKNKFYNFNVTFDPSKIDPKKIISEYESKEKLEENDIKDIKKKLIDAFPNDNSGIVDKLMGLKPGEEFKKGVTNAILYTQTTDEGRIDTDHEITKEDFTGIYETMKYMCKPGADGKSKGGTWAEDMGRISKSFSEALADLSKKYKLESAYTITLDYSFFQEGENETGKMETSESNPSAIDGKPQNGGENRSGENDNNNETQDNSKAKQIFDIVKEVYEAFYLTAQNTIVKNLFPTTYNDFSGIVDDFNSMKKGGNTNTNNANNNNTDNAEKSNTGETSANADTNTNDTQVS